MYTRGRIGSISIALLVLCSSGLFSGAAEAATRQWQGGSGPLWSTDANWVPAGPPAAGDDLVFPALAPGTSFNDIIATGLRSIRFDGEHTIQGSGLGVSAGIEMVANATIEGYVLLAANAQLTGTATLTVNGTITAAGDFEITSATLNALNPNNSFPGLLTIGASGIFRVGAQGALGSTTPPTVGVHLAGGTLDLNNTVVGINRLTGNGIVNLGNGGTFGGLTVNAATANLFTGTIVGTGIFVKLGAGTLTLGGPTTYNGLTAIHQGELVIAHEQAIANSNTNVFPDATLTFDVASTRSGALSLAGTGLNGVGALRVRGGTLAQTTETFISGGSATIVVAAPHQLHQSGELKGPATLTVIGGGTVDIFHPGNTLSSVVLGDGSTPAPTLRLGGQHALANVATTVNAGATLDLNGFYTQIANLSGSGRLVTGVGATAEFTGSPNFTGTFHGAGHVRMMATVNPVTLAGTHTLSGQFSTQSPHLVVTGTIPAEVTSAGDKMTLVPGSTTGPVFYAASSPSGQLIAGDEVNPGGMTAAGLNIMGGTFKPILSSAAPRINVNGTVTIGVSAMLDVVNYLGAIPPGILTLIANDGTDAIAGAFQNAQNGSKVTLTNNVIYVVNYRGGDGNDLTLVPPITSYHLSEGATGPFFDTDLLIANPWDELLTVAVTFLPENAAPLTQQYDLMPMSRRTIRVDQIEGMESVAFSTIVQPNVERTLAVERTMRWDASGYGGHTEKATAGPATTWYFAEGSEGFFRTFLLLANPQTTPNVAHVTWLREGAGAIERIYDLLPTSRRTIAAIDDPELVNQAFGVTVTFDQPGVAERAMYFGGPPAFKGGHESAGVTAPSTTWLLAEGATGDGFDTFILVANPGSEEADVTFTFLPADGPAATLTRKVAGHSRITVNPEGENLSIPLPLGPVGTQIDATKPVIAERAQYWPLGPVQWTEAHNSFGVTEAARHWVLAEGRIGGSDGYQTYILLANPGNSTATVELAFLGDNQSIAPATKTVQVPPRQRVNVPVETDSQNPNFTGFGTTITSDQPIVVERAMYWNVGGEVWAAGTNATATRMNVP